jgi:small conductance mechanosensitive channel
MELNPEVYLTKMIDLVILYGPKFLLAIITLFIGSWFVNILSSIFEKALSKMSFDDTLKPYLVGLSGTLLKAILYISVVGMLGVQTTSLIAVLGAAGFAIGMALQ